MIVDKDFALILYNLAESLRETGQLSENIPHILQAKEIYQQLKHEDYLRSLEQLSNVYEMLGEWEKGIALFQKNIAAVKKAYLQQPKEEIPRQAFAISCVNLALFEQKKSNFDQVDVHFNQIEQIFNHMALHFATDNQFLNDTVVAYQRFALLYRKQGDIEKGIGCLQKSYQAAKKLHEREPLNAEFTTHIINICQYLGMFYHDKILHEEKFLPMVLKYYTISHKKTLEICNAHPRNEVYQYNLAMSYEVLGSFYEEIKDYKKLSNTLKSVFRF